MIIEDFLGISMIQQSILYILCVCGFKYQTYREFVLQMMVGSWLWDIVLTNILGIITTHEQGVSSTAHLL